MKALFQSRLFRRLFFTYLMMIFTCLIVYTSFIVYENHQMNKFQIRRKSEFQLDEAGSILDRQFINARNIVQNLSYSAALRKLYWNSKLGTALDSYDLSVIQDELKNTMACGGLSIYKTIIFLDGKDKAYSSSGMIMLKEAYHSENVEYPHLAKGSLNGLFGFESPRYSFQKECLVYCDTYTYQNGSEIGTVCILFDLQNLLNDLGSAIDQGYGVAATYYDTPLLTVGEQEGTLYSSESAYCPGVVYQVYASGRLSGEENGVFFLLLGGMFLLSACFVYIAYRESRKYYMPIGHLDQIVKEEKSASVLPAESGMQKGTDEMESLLDGIRGLIGEKNGYREKMLTITPYAHTGMLHSMLMGNMEKENIRILSEENYIDLIKPYFIVGAVNLAYSEDCSMEAGENRQELKELFRVVCETFSTDEMHIVYYFWDMCYAFLIISFEKEEPMDELFYQIHKYLSTALNAENCLVTIGVDVLREDINELQEACNGAVCALDGILTDGRGEVYFLKENSRKPVSYYFPPNFSEKLKKCIEKDQKEELHKLLTEIYQENAELDGTAEMYRGLIDELHLEIVRTLRKITELNTTHFSVEKHNGLAPLREVFDYYDAALSSVADSLHEQVGQTEADSRLENEILQYVDENCFDSELSLQGIADHFRVSRKYLTLLYKKRYGMTYLQYIQDRRIKHAVNLLEQKKHSLSEIAALCGYASQLTFRRNFKSIMGINPSDYE